MAVFFFRPTLPFSRFARCWHFCDMPVTLADVRSSGWTGKHLLVVSISGFDPEPTWIGLKFRSAAIFLGVL
jgi:hypothetical protein